MFLGISCSMSASATARITEPRQAELTTDYGGRLRGQQRGELVYTAGANCKGPGSRIRAMGSGSAPKRTFKIARSRIWGISLTNGSATRR